MDFCALWIHPECEERAWGACFHLLLSLGIVPQLVWRTDKGIRTGSRLRDQHTPVDTSGHNKDSWWGHQEAQDCF